MPGAESKSSVSWLFTPHHCNLCTHGKMPHECRAVGCNAALSVDANGRMSCGITWHGSLTFADDGHRTQKTVSSSRQIGVGLRFEPSVWRGCTETAEHKGTRCTTSDLLGPVARQQILRRYVPFAMSTVLAKQNDPGVRLKSTREIDS